VRAYDPPVPRDVQLSVRTLPGGFDAAEIDGLRPTGWRPHDVLMSDNATVQHKAGGDFPVGEPRRFWRYMVEGPRPVGVT